MDNKTLWNDAAQVVGEAELNRRFRRWITGMVRREAIKQNQASPESLLRQQAEAVLHDLNQRTGRNYRLTPDALHMAQVILRAGYTVEDFQKVHEVMVKAWIDSPKMQMYLRPSTLWQLKKFDERLALWKPKKRPQAVVERQKEAEKEKANAALIRKLHARAWWDFPTWAEFVRWTMQLPTAESIEAYPMPKRVRAMRSAPKMCVLVLTGKCPEWAEREYKLMKEAKNEAV